MTTQDTALQRLIVNRISKTTFETITPSNTELWAVDPEFTGNKGLVTSVDGEIAERGNVTDLTSTSITLALAKGGVDYHYGTLSSFTMTANETADVETTIYFTTSNSGITVSLPGSIEFVGNTPVFVAGKKYVISILNNVLVAGEIV